MKYTISLSLDLEGVEADTPRQAVDLAMEALSLGIPALASSLHTGPEIHACPEVGKVMTFWRKGGRFVGSHEEDL